MGTLLQDLKYGLRMLAKSPGFTAVAVLTLALGIGANTAIFSVVDAVLLRPLPFRDPDRLVVVQQKWMGGGGDLSAGDFIDVARLNHDLEGMAAYRMGSFNMTSGERPERVQGAIATVNLFDVLGVRPILGRDFLPEDGGPAGNRVVLLSYGLWTRRFGENAAVPGQKVNLNGEPYTVVGVMPRGMEFPEGAEVWATPRYAVPEHPLRPNVDPATLRGAHYFSDVGRLRAGVSLDHARADVTAVMRQIAQEHPDSDLRETDGAWLVTLHDDQVGNVRPALLVLLAAVGMVLLIACANVANLILARGTARRKELAIRGALGAARARIVRQLLTESLLLAMFGGTLGVLVAFWGYASLAALVPAEIRSFVPVSLDARVLVFALGISLLAGVIFGLAPALESSGPELQEALKEGGRTSTLGSGRHRVQHLLVVSETALALVLLIAAGLLIKSFMRLSAVSLGFDPRNLLTLQLALPEARYPQPAQKSAFVQRALANLQALPGVSSACVVSRLPLNPGGSRRGIQIEGRSYSPASPVEDLSPDYSVVSSEYFRTLGIPLLAGRVFTLRDDARAPRVVMVNRAMARRFWSGGNPVGKRIKIGNADSWMEIVGVTGDVHQRDMARPPAPMMYAPYAQDPWPFMDVAVRAAADPAALATTAERAIQDVDREEPVYHVRTMEQVAASSLLPRRFQMVLLGLFAALALSLAAVGIFGVISFSVSQRTHEIGIRMALGADPGAVLRLVVRQGMLLALVGVGVGLAAGFALTRFLATLLYGVQPTDAATFAGVTAVLIGVALLACYIPARRATKVDPMVALRYE